MQFFNNMRSRWESEKIKRFERKNDEPEWTYNAHKRASQEEIDRILDKIRKSGYDSLTKRRSRRFSIKVRNEKTVKDNFSDIWGS